MTLCVWRHIIPPAVWFALFHVEEGKKPFNEVRTRLLTSQISNVSYEHGQIYQANKRSNFFTSSNPSMDQSSGH